MLRFMALILYFKFQNFGLGRKFHEDGLME